METMYYIGEENDQLLREGRQRPHFRGSRDSRHTTRPGHVDEDASAAVDGGHGSDHFRCFDGDSRAPAHLALSELAGPPSRAAGQSSDPPSSSLVA
jgi:hypothetical protein